MHKDMPHILYQIPFYLRILLTEFLCQSVHRLAYYLNKLHKSEI